MSEEAQGGVVDRTADLSDEVLNRFSLGSRQYFSDAFSIDTKLFITTYEPENKNFNYELGNR